MSEPDTTGWASTRLEPLNPGKRFWSRIVTNLPFVVLGNAFSSASITVEASLAFLTVPFLYYIMFYWLFSGHIGHLLAGGRVRDARTGGRISFWQAVVRSWYEMVPLGVATLIYAMVLLLDVGIATGEWDRWIEIASGLAVGIPMGIMVLMREFDHRHLFDLLSRTIVVDRKSIQSAAGDVMPRTSRLAEAGKGLLAGSITAGTIIGFGWLAMTPSSSIGSPFQPGERDHVHQLIQGAVEDGMKNAEQRAPINAEYEKVCAALQRNDWRWQMAAYPGDSNAGRMGMMTRGLGQTLQRVKEVQEERNLPHYSLEDFCEDVLEGAE